MRETGQGAAAAGSEAASLAACIATILELEVGEIPDPDEAPPDGFRRWLNSLGLGLVAIDQPQAFSWPGPWLGRIRRADGERRAVVMYGVPSGVIWDPAGATEGEAWALDGGWMISALDIAGARPPLAKAPTTAGVVEGIFIAARAGEPATSLDRAQALPRQGLVGDRHTTGHGTFPSGKPGSALTLIEAEVCDSFDPPLAANEHRRNVVTRGIDLNALVGHDFTVGEVRCRGMRLCEPCTVVDGYASRPVLRALVHRGGLRADILSEGEIAVGDAVSAA